MYKRMTDGDLISVREKGRKSYSFISDICTIDHEKTNKQSSTVTTVIMKVQSARS